MAAKPVQISLDAELLERIDAEPEARQRGRSAFIRSAVVTYLRAKRRRQTDEAIAKAYRGAAGRMLGEVEDVLDAQAWPED